MNPMLLEMLAKQRHAEFMQEAERLRLTALSKSGDRSKRSRIFAALGNALIYAGEKLKHRYEPRLELPARCNE